MLTRIKSDIHIKELLKGSAIALIFKVFGVVIQYFFFFILARYYNAQGVGVFSILWTILLVTVVFSKLGFDTAIVRLIASYISTNKINLIPGIYRLIFLWIIIMGLITTLIISINSKLICTLFFHNTKYISHIIIICVAIIPLSILNINAEVFKAHKKITLYSFLQNGSIFLISLVIILIFYSRYNDEKLIIVSIFISIIILLFYSFIQMGKTNVFLKGDHISNTKNKTRVLFKLAFPMLLSNSLFLVLNWTDTLMLGAFTEENSVGVYNIALKIAALNSIILVGVNSIAMPKYAELFAKKNIEQLKVFVKQTTVLIFSLSLPIILVIILFPEFLLNIFGNEFIIGVNALLILTAGQAFSAFSSSSFTLLNMTGLEIQGRNILIYTVIINIILNYFLIPKYGIEGAAIATASSTILWNFLAVLILYKNFGFTTYPVNTKLFRKND